MPCPTVYLVPGALITQPVTQIADSRILITGAAAGFGRLIARMAAAKGGRLILWDIDAEGLNQLVAEIRQAGGTASAMYCDLREHTQIQDRAMKVLEDGPVDILINNAGILFGRLLLELESEQIEETFKVNTLAHFWTVRAFLPAMLEQDRGHIVTISSASGLRSAPRLADYGASKAALIGFDDALRTELQSMGGRIETTLVCPFAARTAMMGGVKSRFLLLPVLEPESVARGVLRAVESNRARLLMPWFLYTHYLCRLLPVSLCDRLGESLGTNSITEGVLTRSRRQ